MALFGSKFSGQKLLDFALGGYDGLDRRNGIDAQAQQKADQSSAYDALGSAFGAADNQLPSAQPGGGPMDAIAGFAQGQRGAAVNPYEALISAQKAGIDTDPITKFYKQQSTADVDPNAQYFNMGGNGVIYAHNGKADQIYKPTAAPKIVKVKNADGTESVLAINPDGSLADGQASGQPSAASPVSAPGSLAQRNNNPGNLRPDGSNWQGMTGQDGGFVQFDTPENGMRAARINLGNQAKLHGINTITGLIQKYAPASDNNDPTAYAQTVARMTGLDPNAPIDLTDPAIQDKILPAMFQVEGGGTPSPQKAPAQLPQKQTGVQPLYTSKGNEGGNGGSLTPEAVKSAAAYYKATGTLPSLGMGKQAAASRAAILNAAAGDGTTNIAGNQAGYKADSTTLAQLSKQRGAVSGFEKTVQGNLNIVDSLIDKGAGSFGAPILNRVQQHARKEYQGDPDVTAYETALQTVSSEYAKVMSGGMGNQAVSDSARSHARELLNPELTPAQIKANIGVMRQEMANRISGMDEEINNTKARIGGVATTDTLAMPKKSGNGVIPVQGQSTPMQSAKFKQVFKPGAAYGSPDAPLIVRNKQDYDNLKSGQHYIARDGSIGVK